MERATILLVDSSGITLVSDDDSALVVIETTSSDWLADKWEDEDSTCTVLANCDTCSEDITNDNLFLLVTFGTMLDCCTGELDKNASYSDMLVDAVMLVTRVGALDFDNERDTLTNTVTGGELVEMGPSTALASTELDN